MTAASRPRRVLVVCLGNICRSPLGAAVLAHRGGSAVEVRSAGLRDKHAGRPAHPLMIDAAAALGYDLTGHRGRRVDRDLIGWADTVLAMDHAVLSALHALAVPPDLPKLRLYLDGQDVPDPYGGDTTAFAEVAAVIDAGADRHL
ncbi:low molecular weight protein-tyrosine-phosphatase [Streptomyces sp. MBT53]|uniref:low molecular weight protein-tyrosine-phosphatase n=1 Tax=Streptomyces sp. MBT53 TaxID=1488384 RepID=UPI001914CDC0|nr:low molecular weight protein-tyrosine-phosphatase [Streptomyces sp. MBT53]MBK6013549.1 low molecular weight phosphotyrosine protein phosphatase [Streptomyces sp. MBT53]